MKIRYGFVSNSSSSSFTCDVCGNTESGYDACPEDVGMKRCHNDHYFCESDEIDSPPLTDDEKKILLINDIGEWCKGDDRVKKIEEINTWSGAVLDGYWSDYQADGLPPSRCPICQMTKISQDDRNRYLLRLHGKTVKELDMEIKFRFPNYDAFKDFVYQKK